MVRVVQRRSVIRLIRTSLSTAAAVIIVTRAAVVAVDSVRGIRMMMPQRPSAGAEIAHVHGSRGGRRRGEMIISLARVLVARKIWRGKGALGPRLLNQMPALIAPLMR